MPSKRHYGYNQMKKENSFIIPSKKLLAKEKYVFDFKKQLIECRRFDVNILKRGRVCRSDDIILSKIISFIKIRRVVYSM